MLHNLEEISCLALTPKDYCQPNCFQLNAGMQDVGNNLYNNFDVFRLAASFMRQKMNQA